MSVTRRDVLKRSAVGAGVLVFGNSASLFTAGAASAAAPGGYGPLVADPAGILDLPPGFSYTVVSQVGDAMTNGLPTPDRFDGAGAFPGSARTVHLVRNHEQSTAGTPPVAASPLLTYDAAAAGGTTTAVLGADNVALDVYVSLAGTVNNCAGGMTPWGTWLSCEENESKAGSTFTRDHGYVFEVDPFDPTHNQTPVPLTALGRFPHEAVTVDPASGTLYLTEDAGNPNGLVYRFTPNSPLGGYGSLRDGGVLEAMACSRRGTHVPDLSIFELPGVELDVTWKPVPDPSALVLTSTRKQFVHPADTAAPGGTITRSRKLEGAWWGDGRAYIVASFARTTDGSMAQHDGQVWSFDPLTQKLRLEVRLAVNPDPAGPDFGDAPDGPDNLTVSPYGGLLLAEDGEGVQHLLTVDSKGRASLFARNHRDDSEFAGVVFSPDRQTLFASIQQPGITFAITGPFARTSRH